MAMRSRREESTPHSPHGQASSNIVSLRRVKAPTDFHRLMTATDAMRRWPEITEKYIYQWVGMGLVHPVKERHFGWTVYPEWELESAVDRMGVRIVAGGAPEGEINEAKYFLGRKVKPGEEAAGRTNLFNMLVENIRLAERAGDRALADQLTTELNALVSAGPPSNGGEEANKPGRGDFGAYSAAA